VRATITLLSGVATTLTGRCHQRATVKDRLADVVTARITFFEKAIDNAAHKNANRESGPDYKERPQDSY
jgi:hypothetical protein